MLEWYCPICGNKACVGLECNTTYRAFSAMEQEQKRSGMKSLLICGVCFSSSRLCSRNKSVCLKPEPTEEEINKFASSFIKVMREATAQYDVSINNGKLSSQKIKSMEFFTDVGGVTGIYCHRCNKEFLMDNNEPCWREADDEYDAMRYHAKECI